MGIIQSHPELSGVIQSHVRVDFHSLEQRKSMPGGMGMMQSHNSEAAATNSGAIDKSSANPARG